MNSHINIKRNFGFWQKVLVKTIILFFVILLLNIFQVQTKNLFYFISYPFSKIFLLARNNAYDFFNNFSNASKLQKENHDLEKENQKLLSEISLLNDSLKDNQNLNIILQNTRGENFKVVLTRIIGFNLSDDSVIIDKGQDDGILENMPLISKEKVIYGKVLKTYKNFSQVSLISAKNNTFDVKVLQSQTESEQKNTQTEKTVYGALKGKGELFVYLDLIKFDSEIKEGDVLVSSGLEGIFPRDLLVGKIISVDRSDIKPFQTAKVQPFFDINNIETLFVITNYIHTIK